MSKYNGDPVLVVQDPSLVGVVLSGPSNLSGWMSLCYGVQILCIFLCCLCVVRCLTPMNTRVKELIDYKIYNATGQKVLKNDNTAKMADELILKEKRIREDVVHSLELLCYHGL